MSRPSSKELTENERKVLRALEAHTSQYGYAPSIREIGRLVGIESTSHVQYCLKQLAKKGIIERASGASRAIHLNHTKPVTNPAGEGFLRLPIGGRIQAGYPIPIPDSDFPIFDSETYVDLPVNQLPKSTDGLFALQVQGESMVDAMIADGDIVVLRSTNQAKNGETVAAWLKRDNETTLKKYYLEAGRVRLQPANSAFDPIYATPEEVSIMGVIVFVYRAYNTVN